MKKTLSLIAISLFIFGCSSDSDTTPTTVPETMYFPPSDGNVTWENKSISNLGWNQSAVQPLLDYLNLKHSKSFIILVNGRIVMENYFNGHTSTSPWYWASAGKTLTSTVTGIAQQEGILNINNKVSDYLGTGWTSAPLAKENLITCKNLLSMNSGLNDALGDDVSPANLQYVADAGTRWAYHNVYVKLQSVVAQASGQTWTNYFNTKLRDKIGMTGGAWIDSGDGLSVYWSTTRNMARFGLLALNKGKWNGTTVINETYFNEATTTSQAINQSYGYLWWLNGKSNAMLPTSQLVFPGSLAKDAPKDMYSALGKNGQIINIVPSMGLVMIRMGNADGSPVPVTYNNSIWQKFNEIILCKSTSNQDFTSENDIKIFPNPAHDRIFVQSEIDLQQADIQVFNRFGAKQNVILNNNFIETNTFASGFYFIKIKIGTKEFVKRFLVF